MKDSRVIVEEARFQVTMERLCRELIEQHGDFEDTYLVGIQPKGVFLAERLKQRLEYTLAGIQIKLGKLDITFHRDDFRRRDKPLAPNKIEMDFLVENKNVVLIDDVLYTGRTIRAALTALNHFGRPSKVELLVLVDRRFNRQLPIQPDYIGYTIDALDKAYVKVEWKEQSGQDRCYYLLIRTLDDRTEYQTSVGYQKHYSGGYPTHF